MSSDTKINETAILLLNCFREQSIYLQTFFNEQKTSHSSVIVFHYLDLNQGVTLSEIARQTGFAKSRVKAIIDDFEAKGYLERKPDPNDQRCHRLFTTKLARKRGADVRKAMRAHTEILLKSLGAESVGHLNKGLTTLFEHLITFNRVDHSSKP
jgi:DNA-binding MarR family transcriptional regulator